MLSYLMAIHFVLFGNSTNLKNFWKYEVIRRKRMDIWRLLREKKQRNRNFLFCWRLANEMYINGNKLHKKAAKKLNSKIINKFGCEIGLGANIGKGLTIPHHAGIVVHFAVDAGENLVLRQNTTIGQIDGDIPGSRVKIGSNVDIGANCCIIGLSRKIGDNVKIGAMSFINKDIPSNCTYITKKSGAVLYK
ncbi:serine acetyltransferase [Escherichia coli]|uniref:serine acetyltransferase n=1 Tax=Escherichia coli TaxID=562 RepID=UPI0010CC62CA|nr:serine O-acetyltransferase [Escherichia coli]EJQ0323763.1 serine acetyltransferase [Escherichia coli]GDJ21395.1 hypothetical protein BvCmsKSP050_02259 [Escherichia coli]